MITEIITESKTTHSDKMLSLAQDIRHCNDHDERDYLVIQLSYHRGAFNALNELEQKIVSDGIL